MKGKTGYLLLLVCATAVASYGCHHQKDDANAKTVNTFSIKGSVHEMNLYPDPPPEFPEHEGRAEFMSYCGICHSLKYITMQPDFPPKTWEAEVTKMIVKYHAPIDSVVSKKIIAYLCVIKSKH